MTTWLDVLVAAVGAVGLAVGGTAVVRQERIRGDMARSQGTLELPAKLAESMQTAIDTADHQRAEAVEARREAVAQRDEALALLRDATRTLEEAREDHVRTAAQLERAEARIAHLEEEQGRLKRQLVGVGIDPGDERRPAPAPIYDQEDPP